MKKNQKVSSKKSKKYFLIFVYLFFFCLFFWLQKSFFKTFNSSILTQTTNRQSNFHYFIFFLLCEKLWIVFLVGLLENLVEAELGKKDGDECDYEGQSQTTFGIIMILLVIIGLIGNLMVFSIIVILQEYKKSVTNWYVNELYWVYQF